MRRIIKVDHPVYVLTAAPLLIVILLWLLVYFKRGQIALGVLAMLFTLELLLILHLACTRIEIDEVSIRRVNLWRSRKMLASNVLCATTEFGPKSYSDRFKMRGMFRFVIVGRDRSKLHINIKLFSKRDIAWLSEFVSKIAEANQQQGGNSTGP